VKYVRDISSTIAVTQCHVIDTLPDSRLSLSLGSAAKVMLAGWRTPTYDLPILTDGATCDEVFEECGVQLRDKSRMDQFSISTLCVVTPETDCG
jgi:hypothetical protein